MTMMTECQSTTMLTGATISTAGGRFKRRRVRRRPARRRRALADIADSDDDNNDNDDGEDGESCNVDGGDGVMSSPSCLDDKLSLLTCLSDDKLNIFDVDDILVESIASMLAVDDADEGGKDEKDNDNDDADNNDNEHSLILTTVDGAKCNVRHVESGSCRRRRCLLTDPCKF